MTARRGQRGRRVGPRPHASCPQGLACRLLGKCPRRGPAAGRRGAALTRPRSAPSPPLQTPTCCAGRSPRRRARGWRCWGCGWSRRCAAWGRTAARRACRPGCAWASSPRKAAVTRGRPPRPGATSPRCCCSPATGTPRPAAWPWRSARPPRCPAGAWYVCAALGCGGAGARVGAVARGMWARRCGFPAQGSVRFCCFEAPLGSELHVTAYSGARGRRRLSQTQRLPGEPRPRCTAPLHGPAPSSPADPVCHPYRLLVARCPGCHPAVPR